MEEQFPLLIYGVWARVAQQNRAVNISSALPVDPGFAAVTCDAGLVVEGISGWNSTRYSKWDFYKYFSSGFSQSQSVDEM